MGTGLPEALRSISRSRGLVRAATAVMVGLVFASGIAIWLLRQGAIADTQDDDHRLGVVLAEQTTRTVQAVDLVLQEISEKVAASGVRDLQSLNAMFGGREVYEALSKRLTDLPQTEAFDILDATGHLVNESRQWPPPDYSLASRDYFRYFAATLDSRPYISEPARSHASGASRFFSHAGLPHRMEPSWALSSRRSCLATSMRFSPRPASVVVEASLFCGVTAWCWCVFRHRQGWSMRARRPIRNGLKRLPKAAAITRRLALFPTPCRYLFRSIC